MDIYIPLTLFLIVLNFCLNRTSNSAKTAFKVSMLILFVFAALRYDFGPDYQSYLNIYSDLKKFGLNENRENEIIFYSFLMSFPSYTFFIISSTFLWYITYYFFYKKNVEPKYYWLLLFYICFTETCIIDSYVAMRSAFFSFMFVWAIYFLEQNKKIYYLAIVIIGCFVHMSSIFFLPMVFLNRLHSKYFWNKYFYIIIGLITIYSLLLGHNKLMIMMTSFVISNAESFDKYATYLEDMSDTGIGAFIRHFILKGLLFIPFITFCISIKKDNVQRFHIYYKLAILSSILALIFGQGMMSRFFMVLSPFYVVALIRSIKFNNRLLSVVAICCVLVANCFMLYNMMHADYSKSFLKYKTFFEANIIP